MRHETAVTSLFPCTIDGMIPSLAVRLTFSTKTGHDADEFVSS